MSTENQEIITMLYGLYEKNINFLKEHHEDVYNDVEELSQKIADGSHKEKYALEMMDGGYFDIKNLENDGYYYASNSYEDAEGRVQYNDFTLNSSWDILRKTPDGKHVLKGSHFKDVLPVVDYINEKVDLENIEYREIFKMVFIGTGLGFHIHEIYKKLNPKAVLIIEPELEIFRLSLFTIDYSQFTGQNKALFLCVKDDKVQRKYIYNLFIGYQKYLNFNVKFYQLLQNHKYIHEELTHKIGRSGPTYFPYKFIIESLHSTTKLMRDQERFFDKALIEKNKFLEDKKVLIISAGPSLDGYIDWIRENQHKFIIVCVDIVIHKMEQNKIIPDVIVTIDPHETLCAEYFTTKDPSFLDNTAIVMFTQQHEATLKVIKNNHKFCSQALPVIDKIGYMGSGGNVGTFAFAVCYFLGANEIYSIGNDAAFDGKTGNRYSSNDWDKSVNAMEEVDSDTNITDYTVVEVKGNFQKLVKSDLFLLKFREDYEGFLATVKDKENRKIYNLSDGAYIEGMTPLTKKELIKSTEDATDIKADLIKEFTSVTLKMEELDFENDIKSVNSILRKISKFKKLSFKNRDEFLQNKLDLMIWILEKIQKQDISSSSIIFLQFTELADTYINFVLNLRQKDLQTKKEINHIANLWLNGLYNLFKDIKKALED